MESSKQVVSLELAQRLKELGVKQESLYWWAEYRHGHNQPEWQWRITDSLYEGDYDHYRNQLSAFTVAELGEMLPHYLDADVALFLRICKRGPSTWDVCYETKDHEAKQFPDGTADTEADARAKMLIYLIENGLMKVGKEAA